MSWEWFFCSLSLYCTYRERERERHPSGYVCTHNRLSMGATIYTRIVIRKKRRDEEGVRTSLILSQMSLIFLLCSHNIYIRGIVINTPDRSFHLYQKKGKKKFIWILASKRVPERRRNNWILIYAHRKKKYIPFGQVGFGIRHENWSREILGWRVREKKYLDNTSFFFLLLLFSTFPTSLDDELLNIWA